MLDALIAKFNSNRKTIFSALEIICAIVYLFIMAYGFSRPLRDAVGLMTGNSIIVITLYFSVFYTLYFIFSLPLKYFQNLAYIRANSFVEWLQVVSKKEISVFFVMFFVVQVIYFFLETDVFWWWMPVSFLCIASLYTWELAPKYLATLFFKAKALAPSAFKQRLIELAALGDMKVIEVFSLAYAKSEVVFIGQSPERKLILSEKIMAYSPEEIEILVARETAEHYYGHIRFKLIIQALVILLSFFIVNFVFKPTANYFGFEFIFDIETLPVLTGILYIVFVLMSLIQNHYLRSMVEQSDMYVLKATQAPAAFISLLFRQQDNENKQTINYFSSRILNGSISDIKRITCAQDYAQAMALKEKGKQK
ncbi:MAG: hypothetical protein KJ915_09805 [Candidatus Omnitrophica bacterium]|nr:hypothetical protein [Candidatus Omnitrophota bacterium]